MCDGVSQPVSVTPIKELTDDQQDDDSDYSRGMVRAFFTLAPGKQCSMYYWDPDLGVSFNELSSAASASMSFAAALVALFALYF